MDHFNLRFRIVLVRHHDGTFGVETSLQQPNDMADFETIDDTRFRTKIPAQNYQTGMLDKLKRSTKMAVAAKRHDHQRYLRHEQN